MNTFSAPSVSNYLSLEDAIARLKASPLVDGVAEFGSHKTNQEIPSSDYDLLVFVKSIPAYVFQMITTIDGRLADVVLVPTETVDLLLSATEQPKPRSFVALLVQKMRAARILYDPSGRLQQVKQLVTSYAWKVLPSGNRHARDLYEIWFWQSFGLLHLERMVQSQDPIHLSAVDMMLTSCQSGTWRSYFDVRQIDWEGEKAAIRHWTEHDQEYLLIVKKCLEISDRYEKLAVYRELVERTVEPIGKPFSKGETAVILVNSNRNEDVQKTLKYWQSLFDV